MMTFESAKKALKEQENIREEKARILGGESEDIKQILAIGERIFEELRETDEGQSNGKVITEKAKELGLDREELERNFRDGLRYNIKAAYKSKLINKSPTREQLELVMTAYVLNFRSALSYFLRKGVDGRTAIFAIAKRGYLLSPRILEELSVKYPDIDEGIIKRAAVHNPKDSESFIRKILETKNNKSE